MTRLTDAQLVLLSRASLRDDRAVEDGKVKGKYPQNAIKELIHLGLLAEVRATGSIPIWRRDEHNAPIALRITGEGLKAIGADEEAMTKTAVHNAPGVRKTISTRPRKPSRKKERHSRAKKSGREFKKGSKQDKVLSMLAGPEGASIAGIMRATQWQEHSIRGFLAGVVRKKLGLDLRSEKIGDRVRVYRIVERGKARPATRRSRRRAA
jgi:Protein of unknown function (DUF3489)